MSEHRASVEWQRSGDFRYGTYSRAHTLRFEGISVPGNAAPGNIPALHHRAHEKCFIADCKSEVIAEPC